jgi:uncharacterized protein (DUF983 family)
VACGESFGEIHADDIPAWLTIGMVGHVVVPMALFTEMHFQWPLSVSTTMTILPRAKAPFIAAIWAMKAPGIE